MRYNKHFRWFLASNINNNPALTYETKPFIAFGYNPAVNTDTEPDFSDFVGGGFNKLDKIKIVKDKELLETPHITINGRDYLYLSSVSNFDTFDDIIGSVDISKDDVFYHLHLQKAVDLTYYKNNTIHDKINQILIFLIKNKTGSPYKYDDYTLDELNCDNLTSDYEIIPLALQYTTILDLSATSELYFQFDVII